MFEDRPFSISLSGIKMNKVITSEESQIDLDPDSMTDDEEQYGMQFLISQEREKRLQIIRDLDRLLEAGVPISSEEMPKIQTHNESGYSNNCYIKFKSRYSKNEFNINCNIITLNQTVNDRRLIEISFTSDEKRLLKLITFFQKIIVQERKNSVKSNNNNALRIFLKKGVTHRKKRRNLKKNDVYVAKLIVNKNVEIINVDQLEHIWKVVEMKYSYENNRPTIHAVFSRTK